MRAVGMTRAQVRGSIRWEAVHHRAASACVMGVALGARARLDRRHGAARRGPEHVQRVAGVDRRRSSVVAVVVAVDRGVDPGPAGREGRHPAKPSPPRDDRAPGAPDAPRSSLQRTCSPGSGGSSSPALGDHRQHRVPVGHVHLPRHASSARSTRCSPKSYERRRRVRAVGEHGRDGVRVRARATSCRSTPSRRSRRCPASPTRRRSCRATRSSSTRTASRSQRTTRADVRAARSTAASCRCGRSSTAARPSGPTRSCSTPTTAAGRAVRRRRRGQGQRRGRVADVHARRHRASTTSIVLARRTRRGRCSTRRPRASSSLKPGFIDAVLVRGDGTAHRRRARRPGPGGARRRPGRASSEALTGAEITEQSQTEIEKGLGVLHDLPVDLLVHRARRRLLRDLQRVLDHAPRSASARTRCCVPSARAAGR